MTWHSVFIAIAGAAVGAFASTFANMYATRVATWFKAKYLTKKK